MTKLTYKHVGTRQPRLTAVIWFFTQPYQERNQMYNRTCQQQYPQLWCQFTTAVQALEEIKPQLQPQPQCGCHINCAAVAIAVQVEFSLQRHLELRMNINALDNEECSVFQSVWHPEVRSSNKHVEHLLKSRLDAWEIAVPVGTTGPLHEKG